MKLREQNLGSDENKSTQKKTNKYPVDQHANYNIIAQHFKQPVTKNKNVDHSVLDFDDLQSIQLGNYYLT